jgi:hypothetical protein
LQLRGAVGGDLWQLHSCFGTERGRCTKAINEAISKFLALLCRELESFSAVTPQKENRQRQAASKADFICAPVASALLH